MCGIAGYSECGAGSSSIQWLKSAVRCLEHRGPDDNDVFSTNSPSVGLAHTRLSILDLSEHGHQPMLSADGQVVLVFNGELYNYRELRMRLEADGYVFCGSSDTEVLLALYLNLRSRVDSSSVTDHQSEF